LPQNEVFFLSLHRPYNCLENISIFHFPIFNSELKKLFLSRKSIEGSSTPHPPLHQQITPMNSETSIESAGSGTIKEITTMHVGDTTSLHPLARYIFAEKLLSTER
jgi:hypothetical protein